MLNLFRFDEWPPMTLIAGVLAAAIMRAKMSKNLTWFGTLTTLIVSFVTGTVLFQPVANLTGLDIVSSGILVALCAEGIMRHIIFMSDSPSGFRKFVSAWMLRDPTILTKDDDKR